MNIRTWREYISRSVLYASLLAAACLSASETAQAKSYWYVDSEGVTHFTDLTEDAGEGYKVSEIDEEDGHKEDVYLDYDSATQEVTVRLSEHLFSPVSVIIKASNPDVLDTDIDFESIITLEPGETKRIGRVFAFNGDCDIDYDVFVGRPTAIENINSDEFLIPFTGRYRVTQANGGNFSHRGPKNFYSIDVSMPIGTPIYAAKDGVVVDMRMNSTMSGNTPAARGGANYIRIRHADGSMTVYVHLKANSQVIRPGQKVRMGEKIAESGNTGYTTGPHLHFAVHHNNGAAIVSIPFTFVGGIRPVQGMTLGR